MNASNYQPCRSPIMVMTTVSDFFTDPSDPGFDHVFRQGLLRPFDTETGAAVPPATGLVQRPQRQEQYTGNQVVGVPAPWLRAYPDPEGFGSSSCSAACWDKLRGFWYVVDRRGVGSSGVFINRLFKCGEWLDTDAVEVATIPILTGEIIKDLHILEVANATGGGYRPVLVLRIGRDTFPTNMADWYGRLCWMEVTGGPLHEFQRISYPRVVSSSSEVQRDLLWSMCVGGIGNNQQQQGPRANSDALFGLVDRNFWASGDVVRRQQGITRWTWNSAAQTFSGGSFGTTLLGTANSVSNSIFIRGTYWKRINWNPFVQNGGGSVMFPALTIDHPSGHGGGAVTVESRIIYPAGFDNRGIGVLYRLPFGPEVVVDTELDDVRSTLHPSECWVDLEGKWLIVHMAGGWGTSSSADRAEARKQLGLFAYSPISYPDGSTTDELLHRAYRQQVTGNTDAVAGVPYTYPARIIPGPGFY